MRKAARHRCRLFTLWKETPFILWISSGWSVNISMQTPTLV
jgi:hypothetical protein